MGIHIAIVGNGRVGRPTAYTILNEGLADELSLVDIKSGLSWAFGEELRHVATSLGYDVQINTYEKDDDVVDCDIVLICAGKARIPGVQMTRRDLILDNARIIHYIAEVMPPCNSKAKFVVVTNPVDALATLFKKVSNCEYVIGTGNHLDTLRFKAKIAMELTVPPSLVEGFVGGEHGSAAHPLWSTIKIGDTPLNAYLEQTGKTLDKQAIIDYLRTVSKNIVDVIGATEYGPAAAFRDIIRSIVEDKREIYSVATSTKFQELPERVNVSIPTRVGQLLGPNLWNELTTIEQTRIIQAAKSIYTTYLTACKTLNGS
jgi:malate dehydrogenase